MKTLLRFTFALLLPACGNNGVHTEVKEICSRESPAIVLPDTVVCEHAPADMISVEGDKVTYMCTKIGGTNED